MESADWSYKAKLGYAAGDTGSTGRADATAGYELSAGEDRGRTSADALGAEECVAATGLTGWETERAILLADETVRRIQAQADHKTMESNYSFAGGIGDIAYGLGALGEMTEDEPDDDYYLTSERKQLAKENRHKEELGMKM